MKSEVLEKLIDAWAMLNPDDAYTNGLEEYVGQIFLPTKENLAQARRRIEALRANVAGAEENRLAQALLNKLDTQLRTTYEDYQEPAPVLDQGRSALFFLLMKEADDATVQRCLESIVTALILTTERFHGRTWPIELRKVMVDKSGDLATFLDDLEQERPAPGVKTACQEVREAVEDYRALFWAEGLDMRVADDEALDELLTLFHRYTDESPALDRSAFYADLVRDVYTVPHSPEEVEQLARRQLDIEVTALERIADALREALPEHYASAERIEDIYNLVFDRAVYDAEVCDEEAQDVIDALVKGIDATIVPIHPQHQTQIEKTPPYLASNIPWAAVYSVDALRPNGYLNLFFVTEESASSTIDLINLVVHEEFGHAVFGSNSTIDGSLLHRLVGAASLTTAVSEAVAVHRELEACDWFDELMARPPAELNSAEEAALSLFGETEAERALGVTEYKFITCIWRVLRVLRALADVAVNYRQQPLANFIDWAAEETGLGRRFIWNGYFNLLTQPGYAPTYGVLGVIKMTELQAMAQQMGIDRRAVNERLSRLALPATMAFDEMEAWISDSQ
jgi:hypothetical protein